MTGASRLTTGASLPDKELAYGEQNFRLRQAQRSAFGRIETRLRRAITQALRFAPDYGRFAPKQRARLRREKPSAFGRMETRLRRAKTQALRLTTGALHPDKELAYGEQNIQTTGVRPDKSSPTASKTFGLRACFELKPVYGEQ